MIPIFSLLDLDGKTTIPEFAWDAIAKIRQSVFDFIKEDKLHNVILTNELIDGAVRDQNLYETVERLSNQRNSFLIPVRLIISTEERARRIVSEERKRFLKQTSPDIINAKHKVMNLSHPHMLTLDVTDLSAIEAAQRIEAHVASVKKAYQ